VRTVHPLAASRLAAQSVAAGTSRPAAPGLRWPWWLLCAMAGGLVLAASFPPVGIWPLVPLGPALLVLAIWRRSLPASALAGLVFGAAFFLPLLTWLVNLAWYVWAALAFSEAAIFAVLVPLQRILLRLRAWPLAVAGWWVGAEAVRDRWPWGGFPWGRLAMSQAGSPTVGWVAVGGPVLLSFLLALVGATLAWVVLGGGRAFHPAHASPAAPTGPLPAAEAAAGRSASVPGQGQPATWSARLRAARAGRGSPALAFTGATLLALSGALIPAVRPGPDTPTAVVAAIQGNVPHTRDLPNLLRASTVTANHAAATLELAQQIRRGQRPAPNLVIWPENSTDLDPSLYPAIHATIARAVNTIDRPVLVGAVLQNPVRNAGQLWLPHRGPVAIYIKRQLVPFGEYIPMRGLLSHITSLVALQPHNFTPGHRAVVFRVGPIRLGDVICYEVAFDNLVSSEVAAGANLLTVQTNDATFEIDGQRGETLQQLAMARVRAVETGRAVVVASTTGVSAIISPEGDLLTHSTTWERAVLEARVPLLSTATLADQVGSWPEGVIVIVTVLGLGWAVVRRGSEPERP
jgi:apolipoprotein N-acyltransferase